MACSCIILAFWSWWELRSRPDCWTAGLSVPILGVQRTPVYRWKPGIWLAAASSSLSGAGGSSGVGPTAGLFTIVLGGTAGQRTGDGGGYQPTTGRRCYVVESTDTVPVCYGNEQDVIFHDGLGQSLFPKVEVNDLAPTPLGQHRICRPWDCGILRQIRVFLDQYQSRHATHV